jgi:Icc-related predicted phosphoesterase
MKLLLFSDVHKSKIHCKRLAEMAREVDVVIGAGDFGSFRAGIRKTIGWLKEIEKPAVLVPGNAESYGELCRACTTWPSALVLHGSEAVVQNRRFFGIGGGIPITPLGAWSYDFTEAEAADLLKDCADGCILVSHSPPAGILDQANGKHLGSTAVLKAIEEKSPPLVVCGHIHESAGRTATYRDTTVVNAGPEGVFYEL